MNIEPGMVAPEINLFDTEKNKVNLGDHRGKNILVLFFPQAFTGVCTKELCAIRDSMSMYNSVNAEVFAISVDSVFTLKKFKEEQQFNFTLLSDFNKEVSATYGSLYNNWILDMKGVSKRSAFVIDKEGIVKYAQVLESAGDIPDFNAISVVLEALKG
jgi:peroxiredoxin